MNIPVVDACIKWNNPLTGKNHFLLFEDALYVEQMDNNLLPPFLLREAGWLVNDTAHIHTHCPTKFTHSLVLEHESVHITLFLNGFFSFFASSKPTWKEFDAAEDDYVHHMTPRQYD